MEEWQKIAEGNTAEIFRIDHEKVAKLFKSGYSKNAVQDEYKNHCAVCVMTDSVPQIYEYIEENGRFGYIMENVQGESLASLILDERTFEPAMDLFARIHKDWFTMCSNEVTLYTDWMLRVLNGKTADPDLLRRIRNLPEGNTLCHGDFHPYNILITPENKPVVIDFANICRGPKEYDIARTYFLMKETVTDKPIAEIYLSKMQMRYEDIQEYVEVLRSFRQYEI